MLIRIQKLAVIILVIAMVTSAVALGVKYERQYKANQATFQRELKIEQDKQKRESQEQDKLQEEKIEQQKKDLELQIEELKRQSSAKKLRLAQTAQAAAEKPVAAKPAIVTTDLQKRAYELVCAKFGCSHWDAFNNIVARESGWNVMAVNKSSGAGGLFQALPFSKTGCVMSDVECQLNWGMGYMSSRYGNPVNAWAFWQSHHWY